EIVEAVVANGHPVAAGEHLARDLGVASFVGRQQMTGIEGQEPKARDESEANRTQHSPPHLKHTQRIRGALLPGPPVGSSYSSRTVIGGQGSLRTRPCWCEPLRSLPR